MATTTIDSNKTVHTAGPRNNTALYWGIAAVTVIALAILFVSRRPTTVDTLTPISATDMMTTTSPTTTDNNMMSESSKPDTAYDNGLNPGTSTQRGTGKTTDGGNGAGTNTAPTR